jgi:YgiT-type zinc finger domain-containing protein
VGKGLENKEETKMTCVICKDTLRKGVINYSVDRGAQFLLIRDVPALICDQCGESFIDDKVYSKIEKIIENARQSNVEIEVLRYAA